jgi:Ca2+-binding EF-hand superfamily protein
MSIDIAAIASTQPPHVVSAASGSQSAPPQQKMSALFSVIDKDNSGTITRDQFTTAFSELKPPAAFRAAGESKIWNVLDPAKSGSVSKGDFVDGMKKLMVDLRKTDSQSATHSDGARAETAAAGTEDVNSFYV